MLPRAVLALRPRERQQAPWCFSGARIHNCRVERGLGSEWGMLSPHVIHMGRVVPHLDPLLPFSLKGGG